MEGEKLLRYSIQLAMLKQLLLKNLITEEESQIIERNLKKDYHVTSNITA